MARPLVIDADSHVEECEQTWQFLEPPYAARPPLVVDKRGAPGLTVQDAFWLIDGHTYPRLRGRGTTVYATPPVSTLAYAKPFSIASQTLSDVHARLEDLDRAGIDIQVLYPTVFLERLSSDDAYLTALMRSYNTWLAARCAEAPDRLKWAAVMPLHSVPDAIAELRRTRELGAVAAVMYGTVGETMLHEPRFDPFWAEAARLGVPVVVHTGWSHPGLLASGTDVFAAQLVGFTLPVLMAFFSFLGGGILARHPELRVCFLEAGADWLPYLIQRMDQYYSVDARLGWATLAPEPPSHYLRRGHVYLTCEGDERLLPTVLQWLGDDQVMASADMPHMEARENSLQDIAERDDLTDAQKRKILGENARRFYGL
ncbi:MAG TPA: amidohydrolase family protein [Chloroflexota bacterium]|jgi:predicted TIM-barrel fold metal-dependent hydrolase|nr:amidohydrolase family protein [Chloroflexota bacterium]